MCRGDPGGVAGQSAAISPTNRLIAGTLRIPRGWPLRNEGAPIVAIDPGIENLRARRAYENAGFRATSVVEAGEGPAVLMLFTGRPDR
jgi:hypothetical protein